MTALSLLFVAVCISLITAESSVYFREQFEDGDTWRSRWVESKHKSDYGKFVLSAGKFYGDAEKDKGLQSSQDAHFYALSSRFADFSNKDQPLVIQFSVKHEQSIDCGGGYIKLFPSDLKQEDMHGDSTYNIMFGPDICGPGTKKVHVIFNYKGKNHLINKDIRCKDDEYTHLYTLIVNPDNTYEVKIDNKKVESGSLEEDWDFLPPKKIKDPEAKRPDDWDEREKIDDPDDKKPEVRTVSLLFVHKPNRFCLLFVTKQMNFKPLFGINMHRSPSKLVHALDFLHLKNSCSDIKYKIIYSLLILSLSVCFCRTGTKPRTSLILMPRSLMTGTMRWMGSGSRPWSPIQNTRVSGNPARLTILLTRGNGCTLRLITRSTPLTTKSINTIASE
uniref:Calreticulin n=1 Tax=Cyprinus carpio TaxID=7962 RepID=A0A8C1NV47_CYPCA